METITFEQLPKAITDLSLKLERIETLLLSNTNGTSSKNNDELITIEEAAKFLHLSKPTIYSKVSKAEIPYMKRGKRLYFSKLELTDFIKQGRVKSNEELKSEAHTFLKQAL